MPPAPPPKKLPWMRLTSSGTAMNSGTATTVSFDTIRVGNGWPAPSNPVTTITFPFAGLVLCILDDIDWADASNGTGYRMVAVQETGQVGSRRAFQLTAPTLAAAALQTAQSGTKMLIVPAGHQIDIIGRQTSGGQLTPTLEACHLQYWQMGSTSPFYPDA